MHKICFFLCFFFISTYAQTLNAIAIVVNKEPITLFEIKEAMQELQSTKTEAINALINDRLEEAEAKRIGIFINDFELEDELNQMLGANTQKENFQAQFKTHNYENFKQNLKKQLLRRKLYEAIASSAKIDYSENAIRAYYETHNADFVFYEQIAVVVYSSLNAKSLENLQNTGKKAKDIKEQRAVLTFQNADPRLLGFLSRLKYNEYSPVIENAQGLVLYQVKAKRNPQYLPYEQIKNEVHNVYINEQRQNYIKDFFEKLKARANIEYLR